MTEPSVPGLVPILGNPLIDHVGVLVADLEQAVVRWTEVTGYTFTPVMTYRTDRYTDSSGPEEHFHEAKIAFSRQGPPFVELMEFSGEGTHSPAQGEGFHHIAFRVPDAGARRDELEGAGVGHDGCSFGTDGQPILWFTRPGDLNGMRLEYIGPEQQPVFDAAGEPVVHDPDDGPTT